MGACDFCGAATGPGKRSYHAQARITLLVPGVAFDGGEEWVACVACATLIDDQRWKDLLERAKSISPALRAANSVGRLDELAQVIARAWGRIFAQPPESFLG